MWYDVAWITACRDPVSAVQLDIKIEWNIRCLSILRVRDEVVFTHLSVLENILDIKGVDGCILFYKLYLE